MKLYPYDHSKKGVLKNDSRKGCPPPKKKLPFGFPFNKKLEGSNRQGQAAREPPWRRKNCRPAAPLRLPVAKTKDPDSQAGWLVAWLVDWLVGWLAAWLAGGLVGGLVDWWIGGLVDWWVGGLGDWGIGGLGDWWIGGLVDWGIGGLGDWGIGGLGDWWIGGLVDWGIGGLGD